MLEVVPSQQVSHTRGSLSSPAGEQTQNMAKCRPIVGEIGDRFRPIVGPSRPTSADVGPLHNQCACASCRSLGSSPQPFWRTPRRPPHIASRVGAPHLPSNVAFCCRCHGSCSGSWGRWRGDACAEGHRVASQAPRAASGGRRGGGGELRQVRVLLQGAVGCVWGAGQLRGVSVEGPTAGGGGKTDPKSAGGWAAQERGRYSARSRTSIGATGAS